MRRIQVKTIGWTHVLTLCLFSFSIAFVISAAIVEGGLGLTTDKACQAAGTICVVFYFGSKIMV